MKFLFVVVAIIIAGASAQGVLTDEQKAKAQIYFDECMAQEKITAEEVNKIRAGQFTDASEQLKCFANCLFERGGLLKDGVLQEAVIMEKFGAVAGEDKLQQVVETCSAIKGENNCDTSFKLFECFYQNKAGFVA